jgi:hypothetical protein
LSEELLYADNLFEFIEGELRDEAQNNLREIQGLSPTEQARLQRAFYRCEIYARFQRVLHLLPDKSEFIEGELRDEAQNNLREIQGCTLVGKEV